MRRLLLVVVLAVMPWVTAQSQDALTVAAWDSVFRATFDAYDRREWRALAREADPHALAEIKSRELTLLQGALATMRQLSTEPNQDRRTESAFFEQKYADLERASPESAFVREAEEQFGHDGASRPTVVRSILGHALEGDSLVHIVFRFRASWPARPPAPRRERTAVDVLTLRRTGDRWRTTLNAGLAGPIWDGVDMMHAVQ